MARWIELSEREKYDRILDLKHRLRMTYSEIAMELNTTKNAVASFCHHHIALDLSYVPSRRRGKKKGWKASAHSAVQFHTENDYTEKWSKKEKPLEQPEVVRFARPMVVPYGSELERRLIRMWKEGTQIKVIADELGISAKAVKNARARLNLRTRRQGIMQGIDMRVRFDGSTAMMLRKAAIRTGSSKAEYIRKLIRQDNMKGN